MNNNDNFEYSLHQDTIQHDLFWGDRNFNTDEYIKKLEEELSSTDSEIFEKCAAIMTSKDSIDRKKIWSQGYQEWYLYHNFFYGKINGKYLDIGAHKPFSLSNSVFFDKCLGWNGICVEPTETSLLFKGITIYNLYNDPCTY